MACSPATCCSMKTRASQVIRCVDIKVGGALQQFTEAVQIAIDSCHVNGHHATAAFSVTHKILQSVSYIFICIGLTINVNSKRRRVGVYKTQ